MKKCFICEKEKSDSTMAKLVMMRNFFSQDPTRKTTRETVSICKKCKKKLYSGTEE